MHVACCRSGSTPERRGLPQRVRSVVGSPYYMAPEVTTGNSKVCASHLFIVVSTVVLGAVELWSENNERESCATPADTSNVYLERLCTDWHQEKWDEHRSTIMCILACVGLSWSSSESRTKYLFARDRLPATDAYGGRRGTDLLVVALTSRSSAPSHFAQSWDSLFSLRDSLFSADFPLALPLSETKRVTAQACFRPCCFRKCLVSCSFSRICFGVVLFAVAGSNALAVVRPAA